MEEKEEKSEDTNRNIDIDTFLACLHKDVNAAPLVLEPGYSSLAFLYCKATFCSTNIIQTSSSQMICKIHLELA